MESYLNENLGDVKPKNLSEEALLRWRKLGWIVRNRKRSFHFTANQPKRVEAEAIRRSNQMTVEQIFAAINFLLELPSAVLDQLSSERKPLFALMLLLLSFVALVICIIELVHKGTREKVTSVLISMVPGRHLRKNPFCSFSNFVGLTCAFCQCIFTTVNYAMVLQRRNIQIQISVMPIGFAFVLLCSKFCSNPKETKSEAEEA